MKSTNNGSIGELITAIGAIALGVIGIVGKVEQIRSIKSNSSNAELDRLKREVAKKQDEDRALRRAEVEAAELNAKVKVAEHNRVSAPKIIG